MRWSHPFCELKVGSAGLPAQGYCPINGIGRGAVVCRDQTNAMLSPLRERKELPTTSQLSIPQSGV